jgi:hypothetical protein
MRTLLRRTTSSEKKSFLSKLPSALTNEFDETTIDYVTNGSYRLDLERLLTRAPRLRQLELAGPRISPTAANIPEATDAWCEAVRDTLAVLSTLEHVRLGTMILGSDDHWSLPFPLHLMQGSSEDSKIFQGLEELQLYNSTADTDETHASPSTDANIADFGNVPPTGASFLVRCPKLERLSFGGYSSLTEHPLFHAVNVASAHLPSLNKLRLTGLCVSSAALWNMLSKLATSLTSLELISVNLSGGIWRDIFHSFAHGLRLKQLHLQDLCQGGSFHVDFRSIHQQRPYTFAPDSQDRQEDDEFVEILEICGVNTKLWLKKNGEILKERDNDYGVVFTDLFEPYGIEIEEDKQDDVKAWTIMVRDLHILR